MGPHHPPNLSEDRPGNRAPPGARIVPAHPIPASKGILRERTITGHWEEYRQKELQTILRIVEQLYEKLHQWAQVGNEVLQPRVARLLAGKDREALLHRLREDYQQVESVDEGFRQFIQGQLDQWKKEHLSAVKLLRSLDALFALGRPAITASLFFTGLHLAGEAVGQLAAHGAIEIVLNTTVAGGIVGGGKSVLPTGGETARQIASRLFLSLQTYYVAGRQTWLADWLHRHLLAPLLDEPRRGAGLPNCPEFLQLQTLRHEFLHQFDEATCPLPQT